MLGEAVDVVGAGEGQIEGDGLRPLRLRVCVRLEGLLPHALSIAILVLLNRVGLSLLLGPAAGAAAQAQL